MRDLTNIAGMEGLSVVVMATAWLRETNSDNLDEYVMTIQTHMSRL